MKLLAMNKAPKNGEEIIIFWFDKDNDICETQVRVAKWWRPTTKYQIENKCKPHWEYITDNNFCMPISAPIGWLPKPEI